MFKYCLVDNRDKLFGEENNLVYDEKEDMDFMFIVDQNVKVNIKGYFRFDDCNKCESLRKDLAYERGQKDQFKGKYTPLDVKGTVLVGDNVNSELEVIETDENDVFDNFGELEACEKSKFLASLKCQVEGDFFKRAKIQAAVIV